MDKVRVLIVDDSAFMRSMLKKMIESSPDFEVVGTANNGKEGLAKVKELNPDIVTMDIEMPIMNGLESVAAIMKQRPTKIIMVSTLTCEGATETLKALELGAVDFIPKNIDGNIFDIQKIQEPILKKLKDLARSSVPRSPIIPRRISDQHRTTSRHIKPLRGDIEIVVIGASTGGPKSLTEVIPHLPSTFPYPVLLVQHMPEVFTGPFATRMNAISQVTVKEADKGEVIVPGTVYVAPGGKQMLLRSRGDQKVIDLTENTQNHLHSPSVDVMMSSVSNLYGNKTLGVMMTGMGQDGINGFKDIKAAGGLTIAQDKDTSVVYGMPRAVAEANLVDKVVPLNKITQTILSIKH